MGVSSSSAPAALLADPPSAISRAATIDLVFRFWAPHSRDSESAATEHKPACHPGILALIEDVVASRKGTLHAPQDQIYVSGLEQVADALVVSRQIQTGVQGFRQRRGGFPVAVSIAIDLAGTSSPRAGTDPNTAEQSSASFSSNDASAEPSHELLSLLKLSKPAQILLTHDMFRQISNIAGVPLKSFPGRFGVYEYLWTAEDKLDLLNSEPLLTLSVLPFAASERSASKEPVSQEPAILTRRSDVGSNTTPGGSTRRSWNERWARWNTTLRSPRFLAIAAAALLVVSAITVVGIYGAHGRSKPPARISDRGGVPASPNAQAQPLSAPLRPPVSSLPSNNSPGDPTAASQSTPPKPGQQPRTGDKTTAAVARPLAECSNIGDLSKLSALAEQNRQRGDYVAAEREFSRVLACDPKNAQARNGLDRTRQAKREQQ